MRSKTISFRVPYPLYDALKELCHSRNYTGISNCMIAIALLAIQDSRRPSWISLIANAPPKLQDYLIDRLLKWPQDRDELVDAMKRMDKK